MGEKGHRPEGLPSVTHANRDLGAITLSLGVAIFPDHTTEAAAIVKAADSRFTKPNAAGGIELSCSRKKPSKLRCSVRSTEDQNRMS